MPPTPSPSRSASYYSAQRTLLTETLNLITRNIENARASNLAVVVDEATEKIHKLVKRNVDPSRINAFVSSLGQVLGRTFTMPEPVRHVKGSVVVVLATPFDHAYAIGVPYIVRALDEKYRGYGMTYGTDHSVSTPEGHLPGIRTNGLDVIRHATQGEIATLVSNIADVELQSHLNNYVVTDEVDGEDA